MDLRVVRRSKAAASTQSRSPTLGTRLRELRRAHGWTLAEVAARSGISQSTLSKVENRQMSLTYDNIIRLAEGLEIEPSALFTEGAGNAANSRRSVTRHGEGQLQSTQNYDYFYLAHDLASKRMLPIYTVIKCRNIEEFGPLVQHSGEEFIYVLRGAIEVHTEHYAPVRLEQGDGVYIDSTMPHAYISVSKGDSLVLGICAPA
jgi:transcriptional regulator with XRE-family HTH domain